MKITIKILVVAAILVLGSTSCKREKNIPEENENEVVTTVEVHVTEQGTSNSQTFVWQDLEADGDPVIDDITLGANKSYDVELVLLDKTKNPVVNATLEIEEENQDHRFYFEPAAASGVAVNGLDNDYAGIPLGIRSIWTTGSAATGEIKITLRHYPNGNKEASDPVTSGKSSTDAEVSFDLIVQ